MKKIYQRQELTKNIFWDSYLHEGCVEVDPPRHRIYQRPLGSPQGRNLFYDTHLHKQCVEVTPFELFQRLQQAGNRETTYEQVIKLMQRGIRQIDIAFMLGRSRALISQYVKRAKEEGRL